MARNVCLVKNSHKSARLLSLFQISQCRHTTIRRPSHSTVLRAWSFDCGLPGRTARMEKNGETSYTMARKYSKSTRGETEDLVGTRLQNES